MAANGYEEFVNVATKDNIFLALNKWIYGQGVGG